jgi:hypothetical protein
MSVRLTELRLPLDHPPEALAAAAASRLGIAPAEIHAFRVFRRGYDARGRHAITLVYTLDLDLADEAGVLARHAADSHVQPAPDLVWHQPARAPETLENRPVVIGAGPCGLLAALTLAEMGFRPIVLERGKPVRARTKDTWGLWRRGQLDPESNVQFGEGGAGTFSDGKLHSGVKEAAYLGRRVLKVFVAAGAPEEILYLSKPHIGTFRLVSMVESIREKIEGLGGEYRFQTRVVDFDLDDTRHLRGLHLADGGYLRTDAAILAPGHSARDTFAALEARSVHLEAKPFSIGVRIEHPQALIDRARFGVHAGNRLLGAADYHLVAHVGDGRSVYSFCMCPGGRVVAATSEEGRVVTNGMSQYSRAEFNANSGIVVGISPERDFPGGPLAGIDLQRHWEHQAFLAGGETYAAPCQTVEDFLAARPSRQLGEIEPSYRPGTTPTDLAACLPGYIIEAIRAALPRFERQIPGFTRPDVVMTGVETRTSSPVSIRRDESLQSLNTPGLYPAGEGAGYAGGIMSAAIDGIRVAEAVARTLAGKEGKSSFS